MSSLTSATSVRLPDGAVRRRFLDLAPVGLVALAGALTIALYSAQGPRSTHVYWLTLVLAENVVALLLRRRHPTAALAGVLATFLAFDYPATMALPLALALLTVMTALTARRAAVAGLATAFVLLMIPIVHRDTAAPHARRSVCSPSR